jgi:ClpP class serine protease
MFRRWVTDRRGDKLKGGDELFTGEVWTGARALEYGLIDGLGTPRGVLAERFPDAELVPVEGRKPLLAGWASARLRRPGADLVLGMAQAADIRATWARYGL